MSSTIQLALDNTDANRNLLTFLQSEASKINNNGPLTVDLSKLQPLVDRITDLASQVASKQASEETAQSVASPTTTAAKAGAGGSVLGGLGVATYKAISDTIAYSDHSSTVTIGTVTSEWVIVAFCMVALALGVLAHCSWKREISANLNLRNLQVHFGAQTYYDGTTSQQLLQQPLTLPTTVPPSPPPAASTNPLADADAIVPEHSSSSSSSTAPLIAAREQPDHVVIEMQPVDRPPVQGYGSQPILAYADALCHCAHLEHLEPAEKAKRVANVISKYRQLPADLAHTFAASEEHLRNYFERKVGPEIMRIVSQILPQLVGAAAGAAGAAAVAALV